MRSRISDYQSLPKTRTLWDLEAICQSTSSIHECAERLRLYVLEKGLAALARGEALREEIDSMTVLKQHQERVRELFLASIGGLPPDVPLNPSLIGEEVCDSYKIEKIILQVRAHHHMTCNLYLPKSEDKRPAVLFLPGHADEGKAYPAYQHVCQSLVQAGIAVLIIDPIGQGERRDMAGEHADIHPFAGCSSEHDHLDWPMKLVGWSLARFFVHDAMRALDYLCTRDDVDSTRIAVTGQSGGGTLTCMLMMAAGDRLAAAAPCSYITDEQAMLISGQDMDNEMVWPGLLADGIDHVDSLLMVAPRPVLILCNRSDFFPIEGTIRTHEKAKALWRSVGGREDDVQIAYSDTQHEYSLALAQAVTRFFSRYLLHSTSECATPAWMERSSEALWCTPCGSILRAFSDEHALHATLTERVHKLKASRQVTAARRAVVFKEWVERTVFRGRVTEPLHLRIFEEGLCRNLLYDRLIWRSHDACVASALLLRDIRFATQSLPTIIAIWPEGQHALVKHARWLHEQCASGKQVLILDVTGSGTLCPNELCGAGLHRGWSTLFRLNTQMIRLGDSIAAMRIFEAAQAVQVIDLLPNTQASSTSYYAEGDFACITRLAACITQKSISTDADDFTYTGVATDTYYDNSYVEAWILPGVLKWFDLDELNA